jgi:hypothetical integral membrane protein (TIGR02206 family)
MEYFFTAELLLPPGVGFKLYGAGHILALLCCLVLGGALCLAYRRADAKGRRRVQRAVGFAVLACEVLKDANLAVQGQFSIYYLPLHLCGLAVFLTLWHSLRPGETLGNLLYSTCMPGAAFALLFPDWNACPVFSYTSIVAFAVHTLLVSYPLMQVLAGDLRPRSRYLPRCLLILLGLAAPVYVFDRIFSANYMFLIQPSPGSPLEWFAHLLGVPGYLLGYIPMLALVWCLLYLPFRKKAKKT